MPTVSLVALRAKASESNPIQRKMEAERDGIASKRDVDGRKSRRRWQEPMPEAGISASTKITKVDNGFDATGHDNEGTVDEIDLGPPKKK